MLPHETINTNFMLVLIASWLSEATKKAVVMPFFKKKLSIGSQRNALAEYASIIFKMQCSEGTSCSNHI